MEPMQKSMYLMHQNMRCFGGGTMDRNNAYEEAFFDIFCSFNQRVAVAGFTEITNSNTATNALSDIILGSLFMDTCHVVACGQTALSKGRPEFIGIGINSKFARIRSIGRILLKNDGGEIKLISDLPNPEQDLRTWAENVPIEATLDYRGVVYTVVELRGTQNIIAVGFIHNIYKDKTIRSIVMQKVPEMVKIMQDQALKFTPRPAIYLGGDFNVEPQAAPIHDYKTRRADSTVNCHYKFNLDQLSSEARERFGKDNDSKELGVTTMGQHLYDYWFSDISKGGANEPRPFADGRTMQIGTFSYNTDLDGKELPANFDENYRRMSDHAAILLKIT